MGRPAAVRVGADGAPAPSRPPASTGYSWVICTLFAVLVFLIVFALLFKP